MAARARHAGFASGLKAIAVSFSPTASTPKRVAAVRELLRQLRTTHAGADPKLETRVQLQPRGEVEVALTFTSGAKLDVPADQIKVRDMIALIEDHAS